MDVTIDELIQATSEAREAIREMHAATKDLSSAVRKARYAINEELNGVTSNVSAEIKQRVDAELDILREEIRAAADATTRQIQDNFIKITRRQDEFMEMVGGALDEPQE